MNATPPTVQSVSAQTKQWTALIVMLLCLWTGARASAAAPKRQQAPRQEQAQQLFNSLPLLFEKNDGQVDGTVSFLSRTREFSLFLAGTDAVIVHPGRKPGEAASLRVQWLGANASATASADDALSGKSNYFIGNDATRWHTGVANYQRVRFDGLYAGVDLVYYGDHQKLEYDLTVAPGADAGAIKMRIDGSKRLRIDPATGDLIARDAGGSEMRLRKPLVYQNSPGSAEQNARQLVEGSYKLSAENAISFDLGSYDHARPLVIDPVVVYSTAFGATQTGTDDESGNNSFYGMSVDAHGFVYLFGATVNAIGVPTTSGSYQPACNLYVDSSSGLNNCSNFFVAKFDPTKSGAASLIYATYIGGTTVSKDLYYSASTKMVGVSNSEGGGALAVDSSGNAYFTGISGFTNYPTTSAAYTPVCNVNGSSAGGCFGAVLTKLSADGSSLLYSTYYLSLPTYPNAAQANGSGVQPGLIAVDGSQIAYLSGVVGQSAGQYDDYAQGITTTDGSFCGMVTATGSGCDSNFFVTAFDTTKSGAASLVYAVYVPLTVHSLAADTSGNVYLGGDAYPHPGTAQTGMRTTQAFPFNGFQPAAGTTGTPTCLGVAFARMNHAGVGTYATYIGNYCPSGSQGVAAVSADATGVAYLGGDVYSNLPQVNGLPSVSAYTSEGPFLAKVDTTQTGAASLLYSTYLSSGTNSTSGVVTAIGDNGAGQVGFAVYTTADTADYPLTNQLTEPTPSTSGQDAYYLAGVIDTTQSASHALISLFPVDGAAYIYSAAFDLNDNLYLGGYEASPNTESLAANAPFLAVPASFNNNSAFSSANYFNQSIDPFFYKITLALALSPYSLTFGNQAVNTTSASQAVTLTNAYSAAINITSIVPSSGFAETDNCQPTLAVSATCSVNVTFTPTAIGAATGTLTFTESNVSGPQTTFLNGTGIAGAPAPVAVLAPTTVAFPNQTAGTTSSAYTVVLSNTGNAVLNITSITLTGGNPTDFTLNRTACGTTLAAGASCNLLVSFAPASAIAYAATLSVVDNATGSPHTASLTGTGTAVPAPIAALAPGNLAFANIAVGSTSASQTLTLSNTGNAALSSIVVSIAGADPGDFAYTTNCGTSIAAMSSCSIYVTFAPLSVASFAATVSVADNATNSPQTATLTGTGTAAPAPVATLTPALAFGNQTDGTTSSAQSLTLSNTGNATLNITSIVLGGANAASFTIQNNTCGTTLAQITSCTISLTFSPTAVAGYAATLSVNDNASGSPQTATLTGTGTAAPAPTALLAPGAVSFASTTVGTATASQALTLSNTGNASLTGIAITLAGANPTDFAYTTTCGATLAALTSCSIAVTFTPLSAASFTAMFSVADNAAGSPQTATLSGTGVAPAVPVATLSPSSLTFANTTVGTTASAQTLTLTNTGNATLNIGSVSITAANTADFADTSACGTTLAVGANCAISVTFTPASVATFTAVVTVTDNAAGSPQTATLSGTGAAVAATDFSIASPTPPQSVQGGSPAMFTINTNAASGSYNTPVVMSVTGLPPGATASFNPATVTPGSTGASTILTVLTPSLIVSAQPPGSPVPWFALLLLVPLVAFRRRMRSLACVLLLGALLSLSVGCGGGYFAATPHTYALTVTGTSGALQHSTTVVLTVQ